MTIKNFFYFRFLIKVILMCLCGLDNNEGEGHQDGNRNLIIITLCMINAVHLNQLKNIYKSISKVVLCCSSTDELETEYRSMSGESVTLSSS